jgi:diadenosine tetraphosphatase ApaH/serine/threonine PP2A family protein phosphatase
MQALVYDVHGNLPALEAVLQDAGDVDRFVLGGDYTLFGAWPEETLARLRELDAVWIRGNGERWTAAPEEAPEAVRDAIAACRGALGEQEVARMAALGESERDGATAYWHGSPVSDVRSFMPTPADDEAELLEGVREQRLVFGHTHLPFRRIAMRGERPVELVNPGSVGMPFDGDPRAGWAILHEDWRIEHRRVAYDHEGAAAAVRAFGGRWSETVARRIEQARFDV